MQEPSLATLPSSAARYAAATRPGFLTAAAVPVLIGIAAASLSGAVHWLPAFMTMIGAVAAHAAINVLNDYYDDRAGCDEINSDRVFPFTGGSRVIQNGIFESRQMASYGWILLGFSAFTGVLLTYVSGPGLLLIGALGFGIGWAYSAPPIRLCARGLGETGVAVGFGVLIPLGAAYVQLGRLDPVALWAGLPFAFLIAAVLYINQFPDYRADAATGKRNWVVRLGRYRAKTGYPLLIGLSYASLLAGATIGPLPMHALFGFAALPFHVTGSRRLWAHAEQPAALKPAIEATLNGTMLQGILITVGLVLSRTF